MRGLDGKSVIVTGGGGSIGRAICERFGEYGCRVGVFDINAERALETVKAVEKAGATVKIVSPKIGGAKLRDGTLLPADGQLQGTPSTVFDAVASVITSEMGEMLSRESAAVDWFRDAFGHLKAIAAGKGTQAILQAAGIQPDAESLRKTVEIEVTAEGGYRVDGRDLVNNSPDTLATALSRATGGNRAQVITIRADGRAVHQSVVTAMDVAGQLGFVKLNIATVTPPEAQVQ